MRNYYSRQASYRNRQRNGSSNGSTLKSIVKLVAGSLAIKSQEKEFDSVRHHKPDYQIVMIMGVLLVLGLIVIYAVSPALSYRLLGDYSQDYFINRQLINIVIGVIGFVIASRMPLSLWRKLMPVLIIACVMSIIALFVPGLAITKNGATRWVGVGALSFQPAELIKLTTLFYLTFFLGGKSQSERKSLTQTVLPVAILLGIVGVILVIVQRDMGTMIALAVMMLGMLYLSEAPLRHIAGLVSAMGVGAVMSILLFPHRMERLLTFLNPGSNLQDAGFHVHQALIAIGSGGLFGLGLGRSVQVYGYLPEAANDSIFAIWAEKFGFIGTLFILGLFAYLLYRLFVLVRDIQHSSARLLASGILFWFASHIIINTSAMLGLMPLTGITLPFLSYGGSSLLFMMIALGVAFHLSRYTDRSTVRKQGIATQWSRV